jgi:hypothetical protein
MSRLCRHILVMKSKLQIQTNKNTTEPLIEAAIAKAHHTDGSKFFTPRQVADRWGWHAESIRRAIRARRIESVIISRRRLVPIAEVERIEAEGRIVRAA